MGLQLEARSVIAFRTPPWNVEGKRQALMKPIQKDELYVHLSGFLKKKGVELKEGPYTKGIHAGCSLLADAINLSQAGIQRAKTQIGKQLDEVRQVIHEKTAPKPPRTPTQKTAAASSNQANSKNSPKARTAKRKQTKVNQTAVKKRTKS
jgi:hypothetical protein